MDCEVFIMHAGSDKREAERIGSTLQAAGIKAIVGHWMPSRPATCRAVVIPVTRGVAELEASIANVVWRKIPAFAIRLADVHPSSNLRRYLTQPSVRWINGLSRPAESVLSDVAAIVKAFLAPPPIEPEEGPWPEQIKRTVQADAPGEKDIKTRRNPSRRTPAQSPAPHASPRLAELPKGALRGFFSYSRADDRLTSGALSRLRERIAGELEMILGRDIDLWQDTRDVRTGSEWEQAIKDGIASSVFFVPIVTPNAINSRHCDFEFRAFRDREAAIGRRDLIFPLVYVDVPGLRSEGPPGPSGDETRLALIRSRQYLDFRSLRHHPLTDMAVNEHIIRFSDSIAEALRR